jgi:transcriptional regulator of acetoin/glycerol metabolism
LSSAKLIGVNHCLYALRMAEAKLVAKFRTMRTADERARQAHEEFDAELRRAVKAKEWQIVDVADLTGWSRETVRKIVNGGASPLGR